MTCLSGRAKGDIMKIRIKEFKDKPIGMLNFTIAGRKGHVLLTMVDGVVIDNRKRTLDILNFHHNTFIEDMSLDEPVCINVNWEFLMLFELDVDYDGDRIIITVKEIKK